MRDVAAGTRLTLISKYKRMQERMRAEWHTPVMPTIPSNSSFALSMTAFRDPNMLI